MNSLLISLQVTRLITRASMCETIEIIVVAPASVPGSVLYAATKKLIIMNSRSTLSFEKMLKTLGKKSYKNIASAHKIKLSEPTARSNP